MSGPSFWLPRTNRPRRGALPWSARRAAGARSCLPCRPGNVPRASYRTRRTSCGTSWQPSRSSRGGRRDRPCGLTVRGQRGPTRHGSPARKRAFNSPSTRRTPSRAGTRRDAGRAHVLHLAHGLPQPVAGVGDGAAEEVGTGRPVPGRVVPAAYFVDTDGYEGYRAGASSRGWFFLD
jgi:hypothetical protein